MRYRPFLMSGPFYGEIPWFDKEALAWDWIDSRGCRFAPEIKPEDRQSCEMCNAEWDVITEDEYKEMEKEHGE